MKVFISGSINKFETEKTMKTFFLIISLLILANYVSGQSYISIQSAYPDEESSWFIVYIDEEPQDALHDSEIEIEDLKPGKYELRLTFNADTIADYITKINISQNDSLFFEVAKRGEYSREARKVGRGFRRLFSSDEHVGEKEVLREIYFLRQTAPKN